MVAIGLIRRTLTIATTLVVLALGAQPARAIQLRWDSGGADLSFASARRCTLVVQAEAGETLPSDWRLVWIASSAEGSASPLSFCAEPETGGDPAAACELVSPTDPASAVSRIVGARFCSADAGTASSARLMFDASPGTTAKMQVVAFQVTGSDSMTGTTIYSAEITLNGGCDGAYPPVVLRASSTHRLGQVDVQLVGAYLQPIASVPISAVDSSWTYPLAITSKSDGRVTAHGVLAAPLPDMVAGVSDGLGGQGASLVPADDFPPLDPQSCFSNFSGAQDTTGLQPKDFAFLDAGDSWHVFYTREYLTSNYSDRTNTRRIGHAVSTDQHLSSWTVVDRNAIQVRSGKIWDNLHVWAPTIVRKPGDITYYLFYTGVQLDTIQQPPNLRTSEIQRIGVATSIDLNTWTQDSSAIYSNKRVGWTFQDSTHNVIPIGGGQFYSDAWQFRDPFVMQDPDSVGRWLMYFATIDSTLDKFVVGVARTSGTDLRKWDNVWPLRRTSATFMNADRDESPHALYRNGNWWLFYTSNHADGDQITFALNRSSPVDSSTFEHPDSLKAITCGEHGFPTPLNQWHATEYVRIGSHEYLSAFSDDLAGGGVIQFTQIQPPDGSCPADSIRLDCPDVWTAVGSDVENRQKKPVALEVAGPSPSRGVTRLLLSVRDRGVVRVAVYDIFGRRVRSIVDGWIPPGATIVEWDGRGEQGTAAASGIYFARAASSSGRAVARVALIR